MNKTFRLWVRPSRQRLSVLQCRPLVLFPLKSMFVSFVNSFFGRGHVRHPNYYIYTIRTLVIHSLNEEVWTKYQRNVRMIFLNLLFFYKIKWRRRQVAHLYTIQNCLPLRFVPLVYLEAHWWHCDVILHTGTQQCYILLFSCRITANGVITRGSSYHQDKKVLP